MKRISFEASLEDTELINKIVERCYSEDMIKRKDRMTIMMDLIACHVNAVPLRLQEMLDGKSLDLAHDVFGINRHLNRDTGELMDCFLPRYSRSK